MFGIFIAAFSFFSIFGLVHLSDYAAWAILVYAISPYLVLISLQLFSRIFSQKVNVNAVLSTCIFIFGLYYYWFVVGSSGNKPALVFIFVPSCQFATMLCFIILFWLAVITKNLKNL